MSLELLEIVCARHLERIRRGFRSLCFLSKIGSKQLVDSTEAFLQHFGNQTHVSNDCSQEKFFVGVDSTVCSDDPKDAFDNQTMLDKLNLRFSQFLKIGAKGISRASLQFVS